MTFKRQFGVFPERGDRLGSALQGFEPPDRVGLDLVGGVQTQVGHFALLCVTEDLLDRVELRCMAGQPFEHEAIAQRFDELVHERANMRGQSVPDHQQLDVILSGRDSMSWAKTGFPACMSASSRNPGRMPQSPIVVQFADTP